MLLCLNYEENTQKGGTADHDPSIWFDEIRSADSPRIRQSRDRLFERDAVLPQIAPGFRVVPFEIPDNHLRHRVPSTGEPMRSSIEKARGGRFTLGSLDERHATIADQPSHSGCFAVASKRSAVLKSS